MGFKIFKATDHAVRAQLVRSSFFILFVQCLLFTKLPVVSIIFFRSYQTVSSVFMTCDL